MKIFCVSVKYRDAASQLENGNTEIISLRLLQDNVVNVWSHIQVVKKTFYLPGIYESYLITSNLEVLYL